MRTLLAQGADPNGTTEGGQTPLIRAAVSGHTHVVRLLLEAGGDPRSKDSRGLSAIDWAERRGFAELSDLLKQAANTTSSESSTDTSTEVIQRQQPREPAVARDPAAPITSTETTSLGQSPYRSPPSSQDNAASEKSRRWIAGVRQRIAEEDRRRVEAAARPPQEEPPSSNVVEQGPSEIYGEYVKEEEVRRLAEQSARARLRLESQRILEESQQRIESKLGDKIIKEPPTGIVREIPEEEVVHPSAAQQSEGAESQSLRTQPTASPPVSLSESTGVSDSGTRKRCPKCNATYDSELLAYCAYDATPLVTEDGLPPVLTSPSETSSRSLVWALIAVTLIGSASLTLLFTSFFNRGEEVRTPAVEPVTPAVPVEPDTPAVGGELAGKELDVPLADYPQQAKDQGIKGDVTVRVRVNGRGRVISVRGGRGDGQLVRSAIAAAQKATFSSEKLGGKPASGTITYSFK